MTFWLSCGHQENDMDKHYNVTIKSSDCDEDGFKKALAYKVVCINCLNSYKEDGLLFNSEEEALTWLTDGKDDF